MDERDLAVDQAADEDVVAIPDPLRELEDLVTPWMQWMRPPATANRLSGDRGCDRRDGTHCRIEHDPMLAQERSCLV